VQSPSPSITPDVTETGAQLFQIDPLASGIAILALIVSGYAVYVAKREPLKQRTRDVRDAVRAALEGALRGLDDIDAHLRSGTDVEAFPSALTTAMDELDRLAPRLKEEAKLMSVRTKLGSVQADVMAMTATQSMISTTTSTRDFILRQPAVRISGDVAQSAREQAAELDAKLVAYNRSQSTKSIELRESSTSARKSVRTYLASLDKADRESKDPE
jgi:hypothetical protein